MSTRMIHPLSHPTEPPWGRGGGVSHSPTPDRRFRGVGVGGSDSRPTKEDLKHHSSPGEPNIGRLLTELSGREIEIYTRRWEEMDDDEVERVWDQVRIQSQSELTSRSSENERQIRQDLPPSSPPPLQTCEPSTNQEPPQDQTPVTPKPPQTFLRRTSTLKNIKAIRGQISSSSPTQPFSSDDIDPIGLPREERRGGEEDLFPPSPTGWNPLNFSQMRGDEETSHGDLRGTGTGGLEYEPFRIVCKVARLLERRCLILDRENEALRRRLGRREEREREVDLGCDQASISDSLNEAISTDLTESFPPNSNRPRSLFSTQTNPNPNVNVNTTLPPTPSSSSSNKDQDVGMKTPRIVVRSIKDEHPVPPPKSSWGSSLWVWGDRKSTTTKLSPAKKGRSAKRQNEEGEEEEEGGTVGKRNTSSFKAIFLATRLLTPDYSSVLVTRKSIWPVSEEIGIMAHRLVRNARDEGISLKQEETSRSRRGSGTGGDVGRDRAGSASASGVGTGASIATGKRGKRQSVIGLSSSIGSALASPIQAFMNGASGSTVGTGESDAAKKQLLRSISGRNVTAGLATGNNTGTTKSPDKSSSSTPLVSPGEEYGDSPPLVEMNAFIASKDRPPTMFPRRNTMNLLQTDKSPTLKLASRFGDDGSDLAPYTDKYGFVYDLRYVRMLLDLKAAAEEDVSTGSALEDDWMPSIKRDHSDSLVPTRSRVSIDSFASPLIPPENSSESGAESKSMVGITAAIEPPHTRHRASTIAAFNPSPAKASSSQQEITISSRGAFDLRPTITSGRDPQGSVRLQKAKLDSLASHHRKPVSALLSQLGEVQDVREEETARKWEEFLKYRRSKTHRKGSISARPKSRSVLDDGSWQDDLVGIANIGGGKTGQDLMKRFKTLIVTCGIPINLRADIWSECCGAKDAFIPGEYHEILSVHKEDEHPVLSEIEKDVKRTFPTNVFFGGDGVGCEKLRRLLTAYAWHDPSIGYCQGMNLVAATLLLIYEDEERAYWTFVSLVRNLLPQDWFTATLQGSMTEQAILAELVAEKLPKIDKHFTELGLELSAVTFGWMLSLFTTCLPIETVLRVWDCFMVDGQDVIILTALAILKLGEEGLLECDSVSDLFDYLNAITERLWSPDKVVQLQNTLKSTMIPPHDLAARRQRHSDMHQSV